MGSNCNLFSQIKCVWSLDFTFKITKSKKNNCNITKWCINYNYMFIILMALLLDQINPKLLY